MKTKLILLLIWSSFIYAQDPTDYINSDTRLYTAKSTSSALLGYFAYGAKIIVVSDSNDGWTQVKSDNLTEGFIESKFISKRLNATDIKTTDKQNPLLAADDYYGSNHLFVISASVKARALPDKTSKSREILTTGDPVPVNYYPVDPEEWVNISGSFNDEYTKFVQRKHLGKRPVFEELIKQFDKLIQFNIAERKTIAERLVELAWNSNPKTLPPAYDRYYQVAKQLQNEKLIADTEMYMVLAKGLANHKPYEEIEKFMNNAEFVIKNIKSKNLVIPLNELVKNIGKPDKITPIGDECGIYLSNIFYYYPDLELSVDEKENKAEVIKVYINEHNKFVISPNFVLDASVSEKDFIAKYSQYIDSRKTTHEYSFSQDDGGYLIQFKDGKLYSIRVFYSC